MTRHHRGHTGGAMTTVRLGPSKRRGPKALPPSPNNPNYPIVQARRARQAREASQSWAAPLTDLPLREQRRLRAAAQ